MRPKQLRRALGDVHVDIDLVVPGPARAGLRDDPGAVFLRHIIRPPVSDLDPDAPRSVYARLEFEWVGLDEAERPTLAELERLDIVRQFDRVARTVIQHLLARVAEDLPEDTREWVARARAAGLDGPDIAVIRVLLQRADGLKDLGEQAQDRHIDKLRSRLEELEQFANTVQNVRSELAVQLAAAEAERDLTRGPTKPSKGRR